MLTEVEESKIDYVRWFSTITRLIRTVCRMICCKGCSRRLFPYALPCAATVGLWLERLYHMLHISTVENCHPLVCALKAYASSNVSYRKKKVFYRLLFRILFAETYWVTNLTLHKLHWSFSLWTYLKCKNREFWDLNSLLHSVHLADSWLIWSESELAALSTSPLVPSKFISLLADSSFLIRCSTL